MTNLPKSASPSEPRPDEKALQEVEDLLPPHSTRIAEPRRDEREEFEAWAKKRDYIVEKLHELFLGRNKYDGGKYNQSGIEDSWQAWQAARASAPPPLGEILETLKFAQEVIHDQAERFHKGCRCQLCESLPESLQRAIELLEGSKVAVPQPSAGPMYEALRDYMKLLDEGCELENRECDCDSENFHTCETCKEIMGLDYRLRFLRDLWGEKWAIALATIGTR